MSRWLVLAVGMAWAGFAGAELVVKGGQPPLDAGDVETRPAPDAQTAPAPVVVPISRAEREMVEKRRAAAGAVPPPQAAAAPTRVSPQPVVARPANAAPAATAARPAPALVADAGDVDDVGGSPVQVDVIESPPVIFTLRGGETLQEALRRWCQDAGWELEWKASFDVVVEHPYTFAPETGFRDAIANTMKAMWHQPKALVASLYPEHRVLVVEAKP